MTEIKHPEALAIARRHTAHQWELADALLADLGKPPKALTVTQRQIEAAFPDHEDDWKQWAQLWRVADAFPLAARMQVGIELHIKAGSPDVLRFAVTAYQQAPRRSWDGKPSRTWTQCIALAKRGVAMAADEEGYFRKQKAKRERMAKP